MAWVRYRPLHFLLTVQTQHIMKEQVYCVHCTIFTVVHWLYFVYLTLYNVHCTLHISHCTLYTVNYTMWTVHCILHIVQSCVRVVPCLSYDWWVSSFVSEAGGTPHSQIHSLQVKYIVVGLHNSWTSRTTPLDFSMYRYNFLLPYEVQWIRHTDEGMCRHANKQATLGKMGI